jgi:adenylate cyclase
MTTPWTLSIYEKQLPVRRIEVPGPAILGRQRSADEAIDECSEADNGLWRVVIADRETNTVSRDSLRVDPQPGGSFRLTNVGRIPVELDDGRQLLPGNSLVVDTNALIAAGGRRLRFQQTAGLSRLMRLDETTSPPSGGFPAPPPFSQATLIAGSAIEVASVLAWLRSAMDVLQSAATSGDFFARAARALVEMVCLDSGVVLLREGDRWQVEASHRGPHAGAGPERAASHHILDRVCRDKHTFWEVPDESLAGAVSMQGIEAVVAAPLLDRNGTVIGVLYGDRHGSSAISSGPITHVEATLVELLARGVAAGLARLEQEEIALAARVQFEQFFSPELARHLAVQPDLLVAKDREVSVLFCDVRGFSRVSERLGPEATMNWIGDVMTELSACVRRYEGVLVDYIGDELFAMWGAPGEQPDHAERACRAALDMLACGPALDGRWQAKIGVPTSFGIGVSTGMARVGNSGSQQKFKYGPLGNTVNLGSRVRGATKDLKCQLLITGATAQKLDDTFRHRRTCQVRVVNIEKPVTLYELAPADRPAWAEAAREYEEALAEFEGKQFQEAAWRLAALRRNQPDDGPALVLLSRAVNCMVEEPAKFDPVWELRTK